MEWRMALQQIDNPDAYLAFARRNMRGRSRSATVRSPEQVLGSYDAASVRGVTAFAQRG
jgi:hypothetical protein